MTPTIYWRLFVALALAAAAWYVVHVIRDNANLSQAIKDLSGAVVKLDERAERLEKTTVENQKFDTETDTQASRGVAHTEKLRRTDREVIAIDKPWPAAVRRRVFDNPDPASGSTAPAAAAATRAGDRDPVPLP